MDPKFQTTFIPKKPLIQTTNNRSPRTINFFTLISLIVFITTAILAAGVWGYQKYLTKNIITLETTLNTELEKFEPALVADLGRLDTRLKSAKSLLNQHIALSSLFDFLSKVTLPSVRFSSFRYAINGQKITLNMTGQARSFSAVALQASELQQEKNLNYIQNPLFSNLNLDEAGNVKFDFTGTVDSNKILYRNYINNVEVPATIVATSTPITEATQ
ncbi:hypothetical protein H0W32_01715 [Patescibacteria group bacterium]|nr:hypothetical protein [Patescibacteria group bacterium]